MPSRSSFIYCTTRPTAEMLSTARTPHSLHVRCYRRRTDHHLLILTVEMLSTARIPHSLHVCCYHRRTDHHMLVLATEILSWPFVLVRILCATIVMRRWMIRLFLPLRCYSDYPFRSAFCAPLSSNGDKRYAHPYRWDSILIIGFSQHFARYYRYTEVNETLVYTIEMPSSAAIPHSLYARYDHRHTDHHMLVLTVEMLSRLASRFSQHFMSHCRLAKIKWYDQSYRWDATIVPDREKPPLHLEERSTNTQNLEMEKVNKQVDA